MHSSPCLCVFGNDQIICYPGAYDVTSEPGDAQRRRAWATWDLKETLFF